MRWLKRDLWKARITIAGMVLILLLMTWVPVSAAGAYEGASGLATPVTGTVQATPTEDATVAALNKEKLTQEVAQQQHTWGNWLWSNAAAVSSALVIVLGALFGLGRWLGDRRGEREKRAEERFQSAVTGLGDEKEGAKIGAAILLRTFLRPGYEQFYIQAFDLAVANLRLVKTPHTSEDSNTLPPLSQALIVVFKEAFPRVRDMLKKQDAQFRPEFLDARGIQLDNAYLYKADLKQVFMQRASLRKIDLRKADLSGANLIGADLSEANLSEANFSGAYLSATKLRKVILNLADLRRAFLTDADLSDTNLSGADLSEAHLSGADLSRADFEGADVSKANLEEALSLKDTNLRGVNGLTKEQKEACKAKEAIIDEDTTTSPSQSSVSPPAPSQSNDIQAPSAPPAQVNTPPSETDGSGAISSKLDPDS